MTMTADDVRRVTSLAKYIKESFTVEYKNEDNTFYLYEVFNESAESGTNIFFC